MYRTTRVLFSVGVRVVGSITEHRGRSILAAEHTLDLSVSLSCVVLTDPPLSSHNRLAWVGWSAFPQGFPHPVTGRMRPLFQVLPIAHNAMEAWLYTC